MPENNAAPWRKITILGSGPSGGIPNAAGSWGQCDPAIPENRRSRASILVESNETRLLIDTSPDLRQQFLANDIRDIDAVLYTHTHADHAHGIDELRSIYRARNHRRIPAWARRVDLDDLQNRFAYIFDTVEGYPALIDSHEITGEFRAGDIDVIPFDQAHGGITSCGFRFGPVAYSTDLTHLDDYAKSCLQDLDIWVLGVFTNRPHRTQAWVDLALEWIDELKPKLTVLNHLGASLDYKVLQDTLPDGVIPAYDGMILTTGDQGAVK